ncbi:MAG: hypothetical protein MUF54_19500 [Polyangiaceae bacterium]|jgi:hypothetical protein|nr:hypothetical protein [Polyangiaceae bacterium]
MNRLRIVAALLAGVLEVAAAGPPAQAAAGVAVSRGWPGYGPYLPPRHGVHGHGWLGTWGACGAGACIDDPYLRRAIRRELDQYEFRRELEERAQRGLAQDGMPPYGARRDLPPPTPEGQVQPAYRHSGEIRPEFAGTGQPHPYPAAPPR